MSGRRFQRPVCFVEEGAPVWASRIGFAVACALMATLPMSAQNAGDSGIAFPTGYVEKLAADMATKPFVPPTESVPEQWAKLNYDQYRDIRFRRERAVWH